MEAKAKAGEEDLSMEEILQSIRKIIADDGDEVPDASKKDSASTASDVLELTEIVEEAPPITEPAVEKVAAPEAPAASSDDTVHDILSTIDKVVVPEPAAPVVAEKPAAAAPIQSAAIHDGQAYIDSLLSSEAATATAAAFRKAQPMDMPIKTTPSPQFRGGSSVEDLVMEALRPMLKSWLANLPTIVERLVEREVRKLAH
jgi:hypothetical protein